jgi:hypothetical protein
MAILDERGLFWWHDEPIPDQQFAPDSSIGGLLKIEEDGQISLDLDLYLPNEHGPMSGIAQRGKPIGRCIQGILKVSGRRILLADVASKGGSFSTNKMSYEGYRAMQCIVSDTPFPPAKGPPKFDTLEIPLEGFEEWLRSGPINISRSDSNISITYEIPDDAVYQCEGEELLIRRQPKIETSGMPGTYAVSIRETASAILRFPQPLVLDQLVAQFTLMEDLFVILADSDYCLDWPWVSTDKEEEKFRFYFAKSRSRGAAEKPAHYKTPTNFRKIRDGFGLIWSEWKKKREQYGPGFYLYLGTRRGTKLYIEHRFVNLVWGLEAFHRRGNPSSMNARGPSLGARLFDVFSRIPIDLDEKRLRDFSATCAKRRNDISHFGGLRSGGSYSDFLKELNSLSGALSALSHALLLYEVGIEASAIKYWIFDSFRGGATKVYFYEVGLLDKSNMESPKQE